MLQGCVVTFLDYRFSSSVVNEALFIPKICGWGRNATFSGDSDSWSSDFEGKFVSRFLLPGTCLSLLWRKEPSKISSKHQNGGGGVVSHGNLPSGSEWENHHETFGDRLIGCQGSLSYFITY